MPRYALLFASLVLVGCSQQPDAGPEKPRRVLIHEVAEPTAAGLELSFPGLVEAAEEAVISFEVPGRIESIAVREGQEVTQGLKLAKLDDREYAALEQAARGTFSKAESASNRQKGLFERGVIAEAEWDKVRENFNIAAAELDRATKALEDTIINAPFNGMLAKRFAEVGQSVQAKQTVFLVQDLSYYKVSIAVPERILNLADPRITVEMRAERIDSYATVSAFGSRKFPCELMEFSTIADPVTNTFRLTFKVEAPEDIQLLSGMTATGRDRPQRRRHGPLDRQAGQCHRRA